MSSKYDSYMNRLEQYGTTDSDLISYATIKDINALFSGSPTYASLSINGTMTDTRLLRGQDAFNKVLTFRPAQQIQMGSYVSISTDNWLITSFDNHPFFPKANIEKCNFDLKWNDIEGNVKSYPCIVKATTKRTSESSGSIFLVSNIPMTMMVQLNDDTLSIEKGLRVIINDQALQIIGVDRLTGVYDSEGYLQFGLTETTKLSTDDFENSIADNTTYYEPSVSQGTGGGTIGW